MNSKIIICPVHSILPRSNKLTTRYFEKSCRTVKISFSSVYLNILNLHALLSGPALGMFEVFGRTGPPILGGHQFCQSQVVDECNASVYSFVVIDSVVRHLVVLDILTNTHDYWLITCTVLYSIMKARGGRGPLRTPLGSLQRPPESRPP